MLSVGQPAFTAGWGGLLLEQLQIESNQHLLAPEPPGLPAHLTAQTPAAAPPPARRARVHVWVCEAGSRPPQGECLLKRGEQEQEECFLFVCSCSSSTNTKTTGEGAFCESLA